MTPTMHAASLCVDAIRGVEPNPYPAETPQLVWHSYLVYEELTFLYNVCLGLLIVLTFVETPLWCIGTGDTASSPWTFRTGNETCPAPDGGFIYLSQIPYVPVATGVVIELLCYGVWLIRGLLNYQYNGKRMSGPGGRLLQVRVVTCVAAIVDSIVYLILVCTPGMVPVVRIAPFCRLVHLALTDSVFKMLALIPPVMRPFCTIFVICIPIASSNPCSADKRQIRCSLGPDVGADVGAYGLIAWVLVLMLDDMDMPIRRCAAQAKLNQQTYKDTLAECDPVNKGFDTYSAAFYSMAVASTNAEVPDQQVPGYSQVRLLGGVWAFQYFAVNFVMLALILAVVYNAYAEALKSAVLESFRNRARGLRKAYWTLRKESPEATGVTQRQIEALIAELNRCVGAGVPPVPRKDLPFLISTLDDDGSGEISLREFSDLLEVVQFSYIRVPKRSFPERNMRYAYAKLGVERCKPFVERPATEGWGLDRILWIVLMLNAVEVVVASVEDYENLDDGTLFCCTATTWGYMDLTFAVLYFINVGLRLLVVPFDRYWLSLQNRFDFFTSLILFVTAMLWVSPYVYLPREVMRILNLLRLLQLLKLLSHVGFLAFIADCYLRISIGSLPILSLVFCATSVWAIAGCQAWGGYVYGGNPALQGSDMFEANMDVLNFNDFPSALMVFFVMIVTGGPFSEIVDAFATKSGGFLSAFFFLSYLWVIFFVFFNCFGAFVIDAFIARYELQKTKELETEHEEQLASLYASLDDHDYDVIAKVRVKGSEELYKRMFAEDLEEELEQMQKEEMHELEDDSRFGSELSIAPKSPSLTSMATVRMLKRREEADSQRESAVRHSAVRAERVRSAGDEDIIRYSPRTDYVGD